MKTKINRNKWQAADDKGELDSCHVSPVTCHASAFTLVEMLVVIAIIAILASLLLPAIAVAKVHAQKHQARLQMADLVQQIQNYDSQYSRMPVSAVEQQASGDAAQQAAGVAGNFTFGGTFQTPVGPYSVGTPVPASGNSIFCNSNVIAILMDITNYPDGSGPTVNANYQKNPQQTVFLNAKMATSTNLPGVGPDLVYRDPWGNPYVITIDLNDDNHCMDAVYCKRAVSQNPPASTSTTGFNGLVNSTDANGSGDHFAFHGNVMVWSAGPDKKIDPNNPANQGVNKDNVLSWQ